MKNTIKEGQFSFLIYNKGDKFIGICKETGYVEDGNDAKEVLHRLTNGAKAILQTVKERPELLPSINQHPPLKYQLLFRWIPIYFGFKNIWNTPELQRFELTSLQLSNPAT